jgi:hypothetical protein
MSFGKYSPATPKRPENYEYVFNAKGQIPDTWTKEMYEAGCIYNEETMFANYDEDGFDYYGYSSYDIDGNYVGPGNGIDVDGYTEFDYLEKGSEYFH